MTDDEILSVLRNAVDCLGADDWSTAADEVRDAVNELESRWKSEPPPDSIRVRIAVAVGQTGDVGVFTVDDSCPENAAMEYACTELDEEDLVVAQAFVEADIPRTPTVQARVVEVNP